MKSISALDVRARFGQVLDEAAAGERFVVERAGQPVAAIVPLRDLERVDPDLLRAGRIAAATDIASFGRRYRQRHGIVDGVASVRRERDAGHGS
jgi:prevent-host-death family protein